MRQVAAIGLILCWGAGGVACTGGGTTVRNKNATGGSAAGPAGMGGETETGSGGHAGGSDAAGGSGGTAAAPASGGSGGPCDDGAQGCPCYGNGTCDRGLDCIDDTCVVEGVGGGGSSATGGAAGSPHTGGDPATGGYSDTGGRSNTGGESGAGGEPATGGSSGTGGESDTGGNSNTGGGTTCPDGSEGCACYGNGTCDAGLECQSDVCTAATQPVACTPETMIDDMEDGDSAICPNQGRAGGWWTLNVSSSGTIDPAENTIVEGVPLGSVAREGSDYGIRFSGSGFGNADSDSAMVAVSLNEGAAYNATVHRALVFWARANTELALRVDFNTDASNDVSDGGSCVPTSQLSCYDHYGTYVTVGTDWQQYWINLDSSELEQEGWGVEVGLDLAHLVNIQFFYRGDGTDGSSSFDNPSSFVLYLDDVSFAD